MAVNDDSIRIGLDSQNAAFSPEIVAGKLNVLSNELREIGRAKKRLQITKGHYDKPEFIEKLAEKLIWGFYLSGEKR